MLGDYPGAWPGYPKEACAQQLWTALRLTLLHAVWCAHQGELEAEEGEGAGAAAAVKHAVAELRRLVTTQYHMAALDDYTLDGLPTRLLTAELKQGPMERFKAVWAHREVLCRVVEAEGQAPRLQLLLSLSHPVPAPLL
jgi:hypothetical protein